jgi:Ca-activated chloride channel homolog
LTKEHFTILDNNSPQQISSFRAEDVPVSVGILVDTSDSVHGNTNGIRKAFPAFLENSNKANEYFLAGFNAQPELEVDWTRDGSTLLSKLSGLQGQGPTALFDACRFGVEKVSQRAYPKRALILITSGVDTKSRFTYRELRKMLRNSDVLLYARGVYRPLLPSPNFEGEATLVVLSEGTGGMAFLPTSRKLAELDFEHIARELRHQYSIGFKPSSPSKDVNIHRIIG